jgi:hydroxymethylglutaryl-CoA lyase
MTAMRDVKIVEVGPRDGLQNEKQIIALDTKISLAQRLIDAGFANVEAASFVSPKWVPQMADGAAVLAGLRIPDGVTVSALVPNLKGLEAALQTAVGEVVIFAAASEAFSQKNINCSVAESLQRFEPVAALAKERRLRLRASISCCLGCPYQGEVGVADVMAVVEKMLALGVDEIDIADTIGVGTAAQVRTVMKSVAGLMPKERIAGHFHDTYGQALANVLASLDVGIRVFHSSVAGLGGCPYAVGATGNVATEDLLYLMDGIGLNTGVDTRAVVQTGQWISDALQRPNGSRAGRALLARGSR